MDPFELYTVNIDYSYIHYVVLGRFLCNLVNVLDVAEQTETLKHDETGRFVGDVG